VSFIKRKPLDTSVGTEKMPWDDEADAGVTLLEVRKHQKSPGNHQKHFWTSRNTKIISKPLKRYGTEFSYSPL
jgi:hypothetical protein